MTQRIPLQPGMRSELTSFEADQETQQMRSFLKATLVLAAICVVVVVGVVNGLVEAHNKAPKPLTMASAVPSASAIPSANRNKLDNTPLVNVTAKSEEVFDMSNGLRYAIFTIQEVDGQTAMAPLLQGEASADWTADWESFMSALPTDAVAAAVYNFEYFTDATHTNNRPVLITYAPPEIDARDVVLLGYFLGPLLVSVEDVYGHYALSPDLSPDEVSYYDFCADELVIDARMCALESKFHNCPFDNTAGSPCSAIACDGAAFVNPDLPFDPGTIPSDCCEEITGYCNDSGDVDEGCDEQTLSQVAEICAEGATDQTPENA